MIISAASCSETTRPARRTLIINYKLGHPFSRGGGRVTCIHAERRVFSLRRYTGVRRYPNRLVRLGSSRGQKLVLSFSSSRGISLSREGGGRVRREIRRFRTIIVDDLIFVPSCFADATDAAIINNRRAGDLTAPSTAERTISSGSRRRSPVFRVWRG